MSKHHQYVLVRKDDETLAISKRFDSYYVKYTKNPDNLKIFNDRETAESYQITYRLADETKVMRLNTYLEKGTANDGIVPSIVGDEETSV